MLKDIEEKRRCTFKPQVLNQERRYQNLQELFERLHQERVYREQDKQRRELIKLTKEMQGCSFAPQRISMFNNPNALNKENQPEQQNIYEKLYKDYGEMQRRRVRLREEVEAHKREGVTFKPQLNSRN